MILKIKAYNKFMISVFYNAFMYTKYLLYFSYFLLILSSNYITYKISNNYSLFLINRLYHSINLNGCVLIKLVQWIFSNYEYLEIENNIVIKLFKSFYENCNVHSLEYTKKIFEKELKYNFDDILEIDNSYKVKSGSIAQIYKCYFKINSFINYNNYFSSDAVALKVVHPEIEYQFIYPYFFYKIYYFLVTNISILKRYNILFDLHSFFSDLKKQIVMTNEYKNMSYFYNSYIDNEYIVIPKPILSTHNILIMEFINFQKIF